MTIPVSMKHQLQMILCNTEIDNVDLRFAKCCKKRGGGVPCRFTDEQFSRAIDAILDAMREPTKEAENAGEDCDGPTAYDQPAQAGFHWQAMIDAIKRGA